MRDDRLEHAPCQVQQGFNVHRSNAGQIRQQQRNAGQEACFATDRRYFCQDYECALRRDCVKLKAAWRR